MADAFNRTYILDSKTKSIAYFENDGKMCYFYDFEGSRKSILFEFYLMNYRVLLGVEEKINVFDDVPLNVFNAPLFQWFQDLIAPFVLVKKVDFKSKLTHIDDINKPKKIIIHSEVKTTLLGIKLKSHQGEVVIKEDKLSSFSYHSKSEKNNYICTFV